MTKYKHKNDKNKNKPKSFYSKYIKSDQWGLRKYLVLNRANNLCELCLGTTGLSVHHLNYEKLGNEDIEDLIAVCSSCHDKLDKDKKPSRWAFCAGYKQLNLLKAQGDNQAISIAHKDILESYKICCLQCSQCKDHCDCSFFVKFNY